MYARSLFALASLLGAALQAAATPALTASHRAEAVTQHCCWDNPVSYDRQTGEGTVNATSWTTNAHAEGTPGYGVLTGAVGASAWRDGGYSGAGSNGSIRDYWSDVFTVASFGLGAGAPVQVRVTVDLDYSAMAQVDSGGSVNIQAIAALHFGGPDAPWITGVSYQYGSDPVHGNTSSILHGEATFASTVGATLHLVGDLALSAATNANLNPSSASASLSGTARYTVSVLTPGAGVAAASGAAYVTPVPEPHQAAMLLAGLASIGLLLGRRHAATSHARS